MNKVLGVINAKIIIALLILIWDELFLFFIWNPDIDSYHNILILLYNDALNIY